MSSKVFVGNLPFSATEADVEGHFRDCGEILSVKLITDRDTGNSRGFAFVEFADNEGKDKAVGLAGTTLGGRDIHVDEAREKPKSDHHSGGRNQGKGYDRGQKSNDHGRRSEGRQNNRY